MRAKERVFVVTQSHFDELAAIDDRFAAELLVYEFQELARMIESHGVVAGPLEVERHQRGLIRVRVFEEVMDLGCNVCLRTPMVRAPKEPRVGGCFSA